MCVLLLAAARCGGWFVYGLVNDDETTTTNVCFTLFGRCVAFVDVFPLSSSPILIGLYELVLHTFLATMDMSVPNSQ